MASDDDDVDPGELDTSESDPAALLDALAEALFGQKLTLTRREVSKRVGVPVELNAFRWRIMGYTDVDDDDIAFTKSDVDSLKAAEKLFDWRDVDESSQETFMRTTGRTFSRLAEWQVRALLPTLLEADADRLTTKDIRQLREMFNLVSRVQDNVWRRHLFAAATRLALQPADSPDSTPACAGFVDIVGFTSRSRTLSAPELSSLIERFESVVSDLVAEHQGRVVKTIGDEVFFVVDDPVEAAWLGAELADQHRHDPEFPDVRVGIAYGDLLHRLGDVLGPVVNMASRLTSVAPVNRVLINPDLAALVKDTSGLRLRRMRRIKMKGLDFVEPWSLRPTREDRSLRSALEELVEDASDDIAIRLPPQR